MEGTREVMPTSDSTRVLFDIPSAEEFVRRRIGSDVPERRGEQPG